MAQVTGPKKSEELSNRLVLIEMFTKDPPSSEFSRGYLACLMDEASEDIDEAGSDVFNAALPVVDDDTHRMHLIRRRAITLR